MITFYLTPKKIGENSIVNELTERFGINKETKTELKPDNIYFGTDTEYNNFRFRLTNVINKYIESQRVHAAGG